MKITMTKRTYTKNPATGKWRTTPNEEQTEEVSEEFYRNYVGSISFFNGFCGGACYGRKSYTPYGKKITDVTTLDPARALKIKTHFEITTEQPKGEKNNESNQV